MTTKVAKVEITRFAWFALMRELHKRGGNKRESGAFLLGRDENPKIIRPVYYDDLDPHSLDLGYVNFDGAGFVKLWKICAEEKLRVVADVHTHPTQWIEQSPSDKDNPMIAQKGHVALIVPNYARRLRFSLRGVGIYEYLGEGRWRTHANRSGFVRITNL
jgi:proteasome lid subunit RPN8/RPN11